MKCKKTPKAKKLCHPFGKGVTANKMLSQLLWYAVVSQDSLVAFSEEEVRLLICVRQNVTQRKRMFALKIAAINI